MGYITGRRLFAIAGPQIVSRPLNFSASLVKPYSEADTYKIYFLLFSSIRHYFPSCWAAYEPASGDALRDSHPSEDLSELPPLLVSVAGQGYHCRLTGSWRNSLPELLWARWNRSAPFLPSLMQTSTCTGGLRASAASLFPFRGTVS